MAQDLIERRSRNKVGFDKGTWLALLGLFISILSVSAGLAVFTFQTKADAHRQSALILSKAKEHTDQAIMLHEQRPYAHDGTARATDIDKLERRQEAIMKRLEVIGDRVGAGNAVRAVRPMEMPRER